MASPLAAPVFGAVIPRAASCRDAAALSRSRGLENYLFLAKNSQNLGNSLAVTGIWLLFINRRAVVSSLFSCCGDGRSVPDPGCSGVKDAPGVEFLTST